MSDAVGARAERAKVPVERLALVESTNKLAKEAVESGRLRGPRWFVANRQTGGYGRFGRVWQSPEGGLWCTLAWPAANEDGGRLIEGLGLRVGVATMRAVCAALERAGGSSEGVRLKWPNDVVIGGRKAAGVLCEATGTRDATWLVVGVGVNVNNDPAHLADGLRLPATSLSAEAGCEVGIAELFADLSDRVVAAIEPESFSMEMLGSAASRLFGMGETVTLRLPQGGERTGRLDGLSEDGRLIVTTSAGRFIAPHGTEIPHAPAVG